MLCYQRRGGSTLKRSVWPTSRTRISTDALGYVRDFKFVYYPGNTLKVSPLLVKINRRYSSPASRLDGVYLSHTRAK